MVRTTNATGLVALIYWILVNNAIAGNLNVQFSAEAVQSAPHIKERRAQIYVGNGKVRVERLKEGQVFVEIFDMENQRTFLLVPQLRTYVEHMVTEGEMANPMLPPETLDPCVGIEGAVCRHLGREQVSGRNATKWERVISRDGDQLRSLHWVDEERNTPLRDIWPDGSVSEMKLLGEEVLNGRPSERWEMKKTQPDGTSSSTLQWYDPKLGISVREELADGYFRELANIKVAPQPDHLFLVPEDYRPMKLEPPGNNREADPKVVR